MEEGLWVRKIENGTTVVRAEYKKGVSERTGKILEHGGYTHLLWKLRPRMENGLVDRVQREGKACLSGKIQAGQGSGAQIHLMARIVVGLSGGVDSSVAAHLLKEQGHEVIGIFMRNWNDSSVVINNECPWIDDSNDALLIAEQLGIPFQVLDLSGEYRECIVDYMFREYEQGRTPNPDILCNREVKFDLFLQAALELGADKVATGHYARIGKANENGSENERIHRLLAVGKDANKDQSYFLCPIEPRAAGAECFSHRRIGKIRSASHRSEPGLGHSR